MNRNSLKWHLVEGPVTYDFTLHLRIRHHYVEVQSLGTLKYLMFDTPDMVSKKNMEMSSISMSCEEFITIIFHIEVALQTPISADRNELHVHSCRCENMFRQD